MPGACAGRGCRTEGARHVPTAARTALLHCLLPVRTSCAAASGAASSGAYSARRARQNMAAFTIGYQNGYSDAKKANKPGGAGFAAAYKTGLNKGLSHEENHLQFLASMKRAKEAYYAATGSGVMVGGGGSGGAQYSPMNPIDTGSL